MTVFSTNSYDGEQEWEEEALTDLARHLRQGVGREWRAELEATELETHQHRLRGRTLRDVAEMLLHRGDLVTLRAGKLRLTGLVAGCGSDYLTLSTGRLCVDARLDRISMLVTKRSSGGTQARGTAPTWRARLTELELTQEPVELYAPSLLGSRRGRIRVVSADHLWLVESSGIDCYLPIDEVTAVIRHLTATDAGP